MRSLYHPPVKRSVEIAGHKTSISLEPLFWDMLRSAAAREGLPVNALVARIDVERIQAETPPGLASAVRLWLAGQISKEAEQQSAQSADGQHLGHRPAEAEEEQGSE